MSYELVRYPFYFDIGLSSIKIDRLLLTKSRPSGAFFEKYRQVAMVSSHTISILDHLSVFDIRKREAKECADQKEVINIFFHLL